MAFLAALICVFSFAKEPSSITVMSFNIRGSENNDAFTVSEGRILTETNHSGGILGGITNGMPVVFRVAVKPTPSISRKQKSVNLKTMQEEILQITGRHDPCIVPRAVPAVEAVGAIAVSDLVLGGANKWN